MKCSKLLLILFALFCGTFGQRFERNLINESIVDGKVQMNNYGFDYDDKLASDDDEENGVVVLKEHGEKVDVELLDGKLEFKFCSDRCMDQHVSVCYEAAMGKYNKYAKGQCRTLGQCGFRAGVTRVNYDKIFWLTAEAALAKSFYDQMCVQATMNDETATAYLSSDVLSRTYINSCDPLKRDKKVVTLYVQEASENCRLKVINAKRWYPPTPEILNVTTLMSLPESTESRKYDDDKAVWIAVGVIGGILILAILAGLGYLFYRIRKQKKDATINIPAMPPKIINAPPTPVLKQEEPVKTATKEPTKIETNEIKIIKDKPKKTKEKKEIVAETAAAPKPNLNKEETKNVDAATKKQKVVEIQKETPSNEKLTNNPDIKDTVKKQSNVQKSSPVVSVLDKRPISIHPKKPYVPIYKSYSKSRHTDSVSENEK